MISLDSVHTCSVLETRYTRKKVQRSEFAQELEVMNSMWF